MGMCILVVNPNSFHLDLASDRPCQNTNWERKYILTIYCGFIEKF